MIKLTKKPLFNPQGDTEVRLRRMIGGNTTNLNDFTQMRYTWVSDWYRQAMNNFWIPEEINLSQDKKDYPGLSKKERQAYDKILSFLVFLDSIQSANLPCISEYVTANEINLCLSIQAFQECVHSQSYSYMLDTICSPEKRNEILYQWKSDAHLLERNTFIGNLYNEFQEKQDAQTLLKVMMANYILEGVYFYSGFCFFTISAAMEKLPGCAQEIRYINLGREYPFMAVSEYDFGIKERRAAAFYRGKRADAERNDERRRPAGNAVGALRHWRGHSRSV